MIKNLSVQVLTTLIQTLLQLTSIMILARLLEPLVFGKLAAVSIILNLATMFADVGLGSAIVQRDKINMKFVNTVFNISILLFGTLSLLICLFSPWLAKYNDDASLVRVAILLTISFFFTGISSVPKGFLLRKYRYKSIFIASLFPFFFCINIGSTILAILGFDIWSIVFGQILNSIIMFSLFYKFSGIKYQFILSTEYLKDVMNFGLGITLSRIFNYLTVAGDKFILGNIAGLTFLGIFDRLYKISTLISSQVGSVFDNLFFPLFSENQSKRNVTEKHYTILLELVIICGLILSMILPLFSIEIIFLVLGDQYIEYSDILWLLLLLPLPRLLTRTGDFLMRSQAFVYESALIKFFSAIITLVSLFFLSRHDLAMTPLAFISSSIFTAIVLHTYYIKKAGLEVKEIFSICIKNPSRIATLLLPLWIINATILSSLDIVTIVLIKFAYLIVILIVVLKSDYFLSEEVKKIIDKIFGND